MNINVNKTTIIIASVIIGFFIGSAVLTFLIVNEEDDPEETPTEISESQSLQADEQKKDSAVVMDALEGDPYEELNELVGLESVKEEVTTLANTIKVQKEREKNGLKNASIAYHCVFTGSPGTGKTTVARILARIYKDLGVIKKGQLVEVDRSALVAGYVGQTAIKTNAVVDSAIGGVLFIDEAYSLTKVKDGYGDEAIATLLKRMEDNRDSLVVIVAGYTKEMEDFVASNPGLKSRFTRYINFPDYSPESLYKVYMIRADKYSYQLTQEAKDYLMQNMEDVVARKTRDFGNGRYARNVFEQTVTNQANRVAKLRNPSKAQLSEITLDDVKKACAQVKP